MNEDLRPCPELTGVVGDTRISPVACEAFQGFNPPKCRECGWGNKEKTPQNNPIAIAQDSQISEITPKEGQSTEEHVKTIVGHPERQKAVKEVEGGN